MTVVPHSTQGMDQFCKFFDGPLLNFISLPITSYFLICMQTVNNIVNRFYYLPFEINPPISGPSVGNHYSMKNRCGRTYEWREMTEVLCGVL